MSVTLPNVYHLRKVAETAARPCVVCYKPTSSVLVTPEGAGAAGAEKKKDFFYTCDAHLRDRGFATPIVSKEEEAARKRKEEIEKEIEVVKKEWEEKVKAREKKRKKGWFGKVDEKEKDRLKREKEEEEREEKEKETKIKALEKGDAKTDDGPRVFELHKDVYQMRLQKLQAAALAKRKQEQLRNPTFFPAVPSGNP